MLAKLKKDSGEDKVKNDDNRSRFANGRRNQIQMKLAQVLVLSRCRVRPVQAPRCSRAHGTRTYHGVHRRRVVFAVDAGRTQWRDVAAPHSSASVSVASPRCARRVVIPTCVPAFLNLPEAGRSRRGGRPPALSLSHPSESRSYSVAIENVLALPPLATRTRRLSPSTLRVQRHRALLTSPPLLSIRFRTGTSCFATPNWTRLPRPSGTARTTTRSRT